MTQTVLDIVLLADLHACDKKMFGRPRLPIVISVLEQTYRYALSNRIPDIAILGDIFDNRYRWTLDLLLQLLNFFRTHRNVRWRLLRGNHDSPDHNAPEKSPLQLLDNYCTVINQPTTSRSHYLTEVWMPWYPEAEFMQRLRAEGAKVPPTAPSILFTHMPLRDGQASESNLLGVGDLTSGDLYSAHEWTVVFLGDFHKRQSVGNRMCSYLGAPIPHRIGENGYGGIRLTTDSDRQIQVTQVPVDGPSFFVWDVDTEVDLYSQKGYDSEDYNTIRLQHESLREYYNAKTYPNADIRIASSRRDETPSACRLDDSMSLRDQMREFAQDYPNGTLLLPYAMQLVNELKGEVTG